MNAASVQNDREISLGTGTILGIFFALAVVCAVFFGLGYSVGSGRHPHIPASAAMAEPVANPIFSTFKPSPGSPAAPTARTPATLVSEHASQPALEPESTAASIPRPFRPAPASADPDANIITSVDPTPKPTRVPPPAASSAGSVGTSTAMVQVAAVSHQEDADSLISNLKRRGYSVAIHSEPQDKLLHVQIGPFPSKKDADLMRQRLLTDGFNAIVK